MLSCKDVADRASDLIDGDLSAWDILQFRLHLAICKGCGRFIEQMRLTDQLTAGVADQGEAHNYQDGRFAEILSILRKKQHRH